MLLSRFKDIKLCDGILNDLTKDERADLMAYIGNGLMEYLLKDTPYYYANSIPRYYPVDGLVTAYNQGVQRYGVIEVKTYYKIDHKRDSDGKWEGGTKKWYPNFQIDAKKLTDVTAEARRLNTTPYLFCFFSNELVVWDLDKTDWYHTIKERETNDEGENYGKSKTKTPQAYLPLRDAIHRDKTINIDYYYEHIHKELFTPKKPIITEDDNLPF